VFAAHNILLNDRVAIKLLHHASDNDRERLVREARAAVRIRSEHVVRVFDVGELDGVGPYIVMEYLDGEDLAMRVKRAGPLDPNAAADCVVQACEALAIAHDLGIVHRDLKPANIFLTQRSDGSPWVKILDFGISKTKEPDLDGDLTSTRAVFGTPAYMSPEQLRCTRDVDHRTDIWALGAVLFYLVAGRLPFDGDSSAEMAAKVLRDDVPSVRTLRHDLPEGLEAIIRRCMRRERGLRFNDVAELMRALQPFCSARYHELILRASASTTSRRAIAEQSPRAQSSPFSTTAMLAEVTGTSQPWASPMSVRALPEPARESSARRMRLAVASAAVLLAVGGGAIAYARHAPSPAPAAPIASGAPVVVPVGAPVAAAPPAAAPRAPAEVEAPAAPKSRPPPRGQARVHDARAQAQPSAPPAPAQSGRKPYDDPAWGR
jgi:serine/threonine-protein kinase